MRHASIKRLLIGGTALTLLAMPVVAKTGTRAFDLPAQPASKSLPEFARQAEVQIIAPGYALRSLRTPSLKGAHETRAALKTLLAGSGLLVASDDGHTITLAKEPADAKLRERRPAPRVQAVDFQQPAHETLQPALRSDGPDLQPAAVGESPSEKTEIVVTGSRLGRTSFNSPTPVNVVGQQRVQDLNINNVGDALNQIPAFRPLSSPSTNSFRAGPNIAGRSLDLRGLGSIRTLTLIDGRRHVPSGDDGNFDLNLIPSIMVQRTEVVTGGASAAYGAGAVAGVVNLILDTRFKGLKGEFSYGISDYGDARNLYGALQFGTEFAGGRGHFVIGGEYADEGGVGDILQRDWSKRSRDFVPNPFFSTNPAQSNGLPANIASDNVLAVLTAGGVISVVHPLQGMQFDRSGNLVPFQFGGLFNRARPSTLMVGGDANVPVNYTGIGSPFVVATKHYSALANLEYELTDTITAAVSVSYARAEGGPTQGSNRFDSTGAIRINRDNAYLTPATAALMDSVGTTFLPLNRINFETGPNRYTSVNKTWQSSFSLKGGLFKSWKWDAFYQFGQNEGRQDNPNSRLEQRWKDAVDAVFAPAGVPGIAAGTIICRTTIANPTNGCIPANVLGAGNVNPAVKGWVNAVAFSTREFTQHQVAANFRGTLISGWAGPITAAVGGEYRTNASKGDNDANSKAGLFSPLSYTFLPASTQKVVEGYAEFNVPVFKNSPLGQSLEVNGAVRRTHYSLSGDATTWKVGGVYELNDEYMLRVTRSHDIRAPTPDELNPNVRTTVPPTNDPKLGIQYVMPAASGGNPNLALETANTFTIGAVFRPRWFPKFRLSVDFYDIKVAGAIDMISSQLAANLCRAGTVAGVCRVGTDVNGNPDRILQLFATYQNVNQLHARGLEFVSSYSFDLADIASALKGNLNLAINGNYVDTLSTQLPDGTVRELSAITGNAGGITNILGVPRWRADAVVTYSQQRFSVTAHMSYIPRSFLSRDYIGPEEVGYSPYLPNSISYNHVSARFYLDLNARVKLFGNSAGHNVELFGGINNVFDKDPPSELRMNGNPLYFSPVGRNYKVGLRFDW